MKKTLSILLCSLMLSSLSFATTFDDLRSEQLNLMTENLQTLKITAIGDIMFHMPQVTSAYDEKNKEYRFDEWFKYLKPWFRSRDFVIGNLETTLSDAGPYRGYPAFKSPKEIVFDLKDVGFNVLTTANNHCYDTGYKGVVSTIEALDEAIIQHTGTASYSETLPYILLEKKGFKVALFAYTYSTNGIKIPEDKTYSVQLINKDQIKKDLALRPDDLDFTIISLHFGTEYQRQPNNEQEALVNWLKEQGVDVVLGSHPHVLQKDSLSPAKDFYVIYSMGNFISNQRDRYKDSGVIVNLQLQKINAVKTISVNLIPTWVDKDSFYHILPLNLKALSQLKHVSIEDLNKIKQSLNDFSETFKK